MLVEIDLLDYLAYQMGCGILSDLRLFQQSERLHRLTAAIPLGACSEQEWLDAAQYLTGHDCASALEARNRLVRYPLLWRWASRVPVGSQSQFQLRTAPIKITAPMTTEAMYQCSCKKAVICSLFI